MKVYSSQVRDLCSNECNHPRCTIDVRMIDVNFCCVMVPNQSKFTSSEVSIKYCVLVNTMYNGHLGGLKLLVHKFILSN